MELGATVCLPRDPRCGECPLARSCQARRNGLERELPVKRRRPAPERIAKTLLLIRKGKRILLGRSGMAGFWELPEASRLPEAVVGATVATLRHTITCHQYRLSVARAEIRRAPRGYKWGGRRASWRAFRWLRQPERRWPGFLEKTAGGGSLGLVRDCFFLPCNAAPAGGCRSRWSWRRCWRPRTAACR